MRAAVFPLLAVGLSLGLLAGAQINRAPWLILNVSASVPVGLYVVRPLHAPSRGHLVAVRLPDNLAAFVVARGYVGIDTLLLKHVAAVEGMTVCRDSRVITIDGTVVAQAAHCDRQARPLPRWAGCVVLGPDAVFLLIADVPDSLDGRYFGPLNSAAILGRAVPIWTRGGDE